MSETTMRDLREIADRIVRDLVDQGALVEAGWQAYRLLCLRRPAHDAAADLREAFESGAEHIFSALFQILDAGEDATPDDLSRMDKLAAEVERIRVKLKLKYGRPAGNA